MKIFKLSEMIGGWYVGNFEPTSYAANFEVGYKIHKKGEKWDVHYHKDSDEITLLVKGRMKMQDTIIESGEIFVIPKYEIADPVFLEDCFTVVVKTKSNTNDKYYFSGCDDE